MAYFGVSLGRRPGAETNKRETQSQEKTIEGSKPEPHPHFASQIGLRPATNATPVAESPSPIPRSPTTIPEPLLCPLCRGSLAVEDRLYRCQERCGGRWVETSPGHLVDVAALPYGVCTCCSSPQALVKSDAGVVCPVSGRAYLLLPDGTTFLADATPYGVCQCCIPPMPLVWQAGSVVCLSKPGNRYQHDGGGLALAPKGKTTATPQETLQVIDAALRRNNAWVTVNGLFDVE